MTLTTRITSDYRKCNEWFEGAALHDHLKHPSSATSSGLMVTAAQRDLSPQAVPATLSHSLFIDFICYLTVSSYTLFQFGPNVLRPIATPTSVVDQSPDRPREE